MMLMPVIVLVLLPLLMISVTTHDVDNNECTDDEILKHIDY